MDVEVQLGLPPKELTGSMTVTEYPQVLDSKRYG